MMLPGLECVDRLGNDPARIGVNASCYTRLGQPEPTATLSGTNNMNVNAASETSLEWQS